ncbi:MAG: NADH-quinone oxidoreductase subunit B family protein [Planctomycetota bacterium]|jgi:coenzyme F420-reducing hydrogenase gamma subunit
MAGRTTDRPKLAVYKFSSCDGCQLSVLDLEDELLSLAGTVNIAYFLEARRAVEPGPYDIGLVEGSISTPEEAERIVQVRAECRHLVTIGACATSGGIQALRNWGNVDEFARIVYAHPEYTETLDTASPIAAHVLVDFELRGCPVNKYQLVEVITALLIGRRPQIPTFSVCHKCKRDGNVCVMVATGTPCLGPITQAGCGAICPSFCRGCYGCFGPSESANPQVLCGHLERGGVTPPELVRMLRGFNGYLEPFKQASDQYEQRSC